MKTSKADDAADRSEGAIAPGYSDLDALRARSCRGYQGANAGQDGEDLKSVVGSHRGLTEKMMVSQLSPE